MYLSYTVQTYRRSTVPLSKRRAKIRERIGGSAGRLVGEDASDVSLELEEILLEPTLIVGLLVLSDDEDVLVCRRTARLVRWHLEEEIYLTFPIFELVGGFGGMKLMRCVR